MSIKQNITSLQSLLEQVNALPDAGGVELPELSSPATEDKILAGYEAIDQEGSKITGTIPTKAYSDLIVSGPDVTIPAGFYEYTNVISITEAAIADPSITIDASGLIVAKVKQQADGYVYDGDESFTTKQLTTQSAKTITPTKSAQIAVPSGVYTTGAVTVAAIPSQYITTTDATASAGEIMSGETAYVNGNKVTGTFTLGVELSEQDTLISIIKNAVNNLPAAGGGGGSSELNLQDKTVTPTTSAQTITADSSYDGLSKVTVNAIPSTYVKPTSTKAATTYTPTTTNQTIAAGTYCSGTQTIKGDSNLIASNIKSGVSIFGVNGSYEGSGSGGSSSFETCTVQVKQGDGPPGLAPPVLAPLVYYTDTDLGPQILNDFGSFTVPKNTIIAIDGWSSMSRASGATQLFYLGGLAAYRISENAIFTVMD